MIKEGKFGPQEAIALLTITVVSKVFYTSPAAVAGLVGTAGWYMTLISAFVAALGFTFIYILLKRFPGKDIVEIYEITLGPLFGCAFAFLFALFMMYIAATRVREFSEVLKVYTMPITPISFVVTLFIGAVATLNLLGLETIARFSRLNIYTMVGGFFTVILLGTQNYKLHHLYPILGYGLDKTLYHGVLRSSVYGEIIILAVFAPSLQGIKYIKKVGYTSLALSAFFISISLLTFLLTFPYNIAMEITSPMYSMATLIDYGRFLQRVEPIFLFIMSISSIISVSVVLNAFVSIYAKIFRIQDTKPVILAVSIIAFALAMVPRSIGDVIFASVKNLRQYGGGFFFIPPIIALAAARLRNKGGESDA